MDHPIDDGHGGDMEIIIMDLNPEAVIVGSFTIVLGPGRTGRNGCGSSDRDSSQCQI